MNLSLPTCKPPGSRHAEFRDEGANDWLGAGVRVTPQPFNIERFGVIAAARSDDHVNDWIPI